MFLKFTGSLVLIQKLTCSIFILYGISKSKCEIWIWGPWLDSPLLNFDSCLKVNLVFNEIFWTDNSRPEGNNSSGEKVIFWPNYTFGLTTKSVNKNARFDHDIFWHVFTNLLHTGEYFTIAFGIFSWTKILHLGIRPQHTVVNWWFTEIIFKFEKNYLSVNELYKLHFSNLYSHIIRWDGHAH